MLPGQSLELDWIAAFQGNGHLARVMLWFSYLGSEALPYALPFTYFVLSRSIGARLYLISSISDALIGILKLAVHSPRPFWVDSRIKALAGSANYGMPSGHVLGAAVVWPLVAKAAGRSAKTELPQRSAEIAKLRRVPFLLNFLNSCAVCAFSRLLLSSHLLRLWPSCLAVMAVVLVSVSRVYLGVHFISDVVAAWLVAAGLVCGFGWLERKSTPWLASLNTRWLFGIALWAAFALLAASVGVQTLVAELARPLAWPHCPANAVDLKGLCRASGQLFSAACGIIMANRWAPFETTGPVWRRFAALAYALAGVWLIRELGRLLPAFAAESLQLPLEFLRSSVPNWWILFLAPWILLRMGLITSSSSPFPPQRPSKLDYARENPQRTPPGLADALHQRQ